MTEVTGRKLDFIALWLEAGLKDMVTPLGSRGSREVVNADFVHLLLTAFEVRLHSYRLTPTAKNRPLARNHQRSSTQSYEGSNQNCSAVQTAVAGITISLSPKIGKSSTVD